VVAKKCIGPIYKLSESNDLSFTEPLVRVSPNPAVDFLHLDFRVKAQNVSVLLYDILGTKIRSEVISERCMQLDISDLNPGLYFLEMRLAGKRSIQKMVKQQ